MAFFHGGTHTKTISDFLDFSANTSPLGVNTEAAKALTALSMDFSILAAYPDPNCTELKELLAKFWEFEGPILCGAGAADLIQLISLVYGKNVQGTAFNLIIEPAFSEFENALNLVCHEDKILHLPLDEKNDFLWTEEDFNKFEKILAGGVPLVFMASPSNPSGNLVSREMLFRIADACEKTQTVLCLDSCFCQFSDESENTVRALIKESKRFPHLIILNAFTKIYGMAGLRLGYALCCSEVTYNSLVKSMRSWSISTDAQVTGSAVIRSELKGKPWQKQIQNIVHKEKKRLVSFLQTQDLRIVDGEANYVLFKLSDKLQKRAEDYALYYETKVVQKKERSFSRKQTLFEIHEDIVDPPSAPLCRAMAKNNMLIRGCSDFFGLDSTWYRVAVKDTDENLKLIEKLKEIFSYEH